MQDWNLMFSVVSHHAKQVVKTNVFHIGDNLTSGDNTKGHSNFPFWDVINLR